MPPGFAPPAPKPGDPPLHVGVQPIRQVKPGLYMISGAGCTIAVRTTPDGVVVVDTKLASQATFDAIMAQIRTVSDQPVKFVVDTHSHFDHTGNNGLFIAAGAQVIGQELEKTALQDWVAPPGFSTPALPTMTYKRDHTIALGGRKIELHYYGRGHTGGDTIVYFPDLKTIATGDLMHLGTPLIDYRAGGSLVEWLHTLDQVLKLDFDTVIPGHGDDPLTRNDVRVYRHKLEILLTRGRALLRAGVPKSQFVQKLDLKDIGWDMDSPVMHRASYIDGFYAEMYTGE